MSSWTFATKSARPENATGRALILGFSSKGVGINQEEANHPPTIFVGPEQFTVALTNIVKRRKNVEER